MNHNSYPSNYESENDSQPNDSYTEWQEAMKDVEFQGGKASVSMVGQEVADTLAGPEIHEKPISKMEKLLGKIQGVKDFIKTKFGIQSSEKLVKMTDHALVYVAKETITAADKDGIRTEAEAAEIEEAVSSVVVQGAMEEAGMEQSAGENPILELNQSDAQPDLMASIETLHEEGVMLPNGESVAGLATRIIERDKKWDLTKVSGQLGSNEGGWYEKPNGERFYVKFYENPSQGQAEFVANAVYAKLGIKAVRSEIIQLDGREAIASPAVPEATPANGEAQGGSEDVQKGFVADAFLANWDVVGLVYDNIVQGEDGFYRIDNGGSLIFRAQGGDKAYSPDSIPELQSMRIPGRPTGEVFAGITEDEIGRQARELVSKLSSEDIRAIVDESGLEGEDRDRILTGLLGRREYLAKTYGEPEPEEPSNPESRERRPRRSISETIRILSSKEMERTGETVVRPRTEIVCDHDHIEGQKIDVINKRDRGTMEFSFKLRAPTEVITALATKPEGEGEDAQAEITTPSGAVLRRGKITYEGASSDDSYELCDASVFEKGGVKVFIADPSSRNGEKWLISIAYNNSNLVRTAMGLVKVEVPSGMDPEVTEQILGEILEKDLGIPDALGEVPEEAEREYKMARYKWQHVITGDLTPEQMEQAEKLHREEVFPGYTTLVERGKHEEYLGRYGEDIRAIHHLWTGSAKSIYRILTQGLMCTTERYSRGVMKNGMSSTTDMDTGGADSVFTRIANEARRREMNGAVVVFKPEVFDRTDWYSYNSDTYGSTDDYYFVDRLSPNTVFDEITNPNSYYSCSNEQMFRTGIGARFVESIEVGSDLRDGIIAELRSMGLEEIDGKPIEEVVILRKTPTQGSAPDPTSNLNISNQSLEEYAEKQKLEQAEKLAKMQALISGEEPYTSIDEMIDLASAGDDFNTSFKSMIKSVVAHGGKIQLSNDIAEYIKKEMNLDELKALALGEALDDYPDKELFSYVQSILGIDYGILYEEALASQLKTTPETPSSEPWPDNWGDWDESFSTPTPEPPSESVDDWM